MSGELTFAALLALIGATLVYVGVAEHYEQKANRAACPGRYVQVGDHRGSGLCIKPDGILWERK